MNKQRGFIRMEGLGGLIVLAMIGLASIAFGAVALAYWLWQHVNFI